MPIPPLHDIFENEAPLQLASSTYKRELSTLDLDRFPEIHDFQMRLSGAKSLTDQHLQFISPTLGVLASFPWWDDANNSFFHRPGFHLFGPIDDPFSDTDQGWQILIWKHQDYIYVMEGEEPNCRDFSVWFKVHESHFINQWHQLKETFLT